MQSRLVCLCLLAIGACGDDGGVTPIDARVIDSPMVDAPPDNCDYAEQRDGTNDVIADPPGTAEATNLIFRDRTVICGAFESTHWDGDITVDVDGYSLMVANETDALIRLRATGAEAIAFVGIDVKTGPALDMVVGKITFYGDHGVSSVHLPAGNYKLEVFAYHDAAIASTVAYEIEFVTDTPGLRCPDLTTGGYAEANDTGTNNGNDTYSITNSTITFTALATDAPEPTAFTLSPSADQRISGSIANITTTDSYEDRDTFAFTTGSMTNELTVRLGWPGSANLDFFLFEATKATAEIRAIETKTTGPEATTFSVKPSTAYWLMIGARTSLSTAKTYSASLCSARFVP